MHRFFSTALAGALIFGFSLSARADTTTYDVTFNSDYYGPAVGSGSFTVDSTGTVTFLDFYVDSDEFTLLGGTASANADGTDLVYTGTGEFEDLAIDSNGTYEAAGGDDDGTIVVTKEIASTPEPSSLALLGTGILGVGGVLRRRFV